MRACKQSIRPPPASEPTHAAATDRPAGLSAERDRHQFRSRGGDGPGTRRLLCTVRPSLSACPTRRDADFEPALPVAGASTRILASNSRLAPRYDSPSPCPSAADGRSTQRRYFEIRAALLPIPSTSPSLHTK